MLSCAYYIHMCSEEMYGSCDWATMPCDLQYIKSPEMDTSMTQIKT